MRIIDELLNLKQKLSTTGAHHALRSFLHTGWPLRASALVAMMLLSACAGRDPKKEITGTWKIDSVYTFYSGFGSMETTIVDLEQYTYLPGDQVNVSWSGTTRGLKYDLATQDTLKYFENDREVSRYLIIKLADGRMVLRKDKPPLFAGGKQERYEIRYFSKVASSQGDSK